MALIDLLDRILPLCGVPNSVMTGSFAFEVEKNQSLGQRARDMGKG